MKIERSLKSLLIVALVCGGGALAEASPIECQCAQWSESSFWIAKVCVNQRCRNGDPDNCRCTQYKEVHYERQNCQSWRTNFCAAVAANSESSAPPELTARVRSEPGKSVETQPVLLVAEARLASSCTCAREIEYETHVRRCGMRYRYNGWDWSFSHPDGTSSCDTKSARLKECVEWRGPGC